MFRRHAEPTTTTPAAAHAREDHQVLLDVRERHEWAAGHAPGAVHLPMGQLHPDRIPRQGQLLCVCRSGSRSASVVSALRRAGYDAVNVEGGMHAWRAHGLPVVRDDGTPGRIV